MNIKNANKPGERRKGIIISRTGCFSNSSFRFIKFSYAVLSFRTNGPHAILTL